MIISNINPSAEVVTGMVELYNSSTHTLEQVCTCSDILMDFTVERVGESGKFFGYGICQKTNINLIDIDRVIDVSTANYAINYYSVDGESINPYPKFYITEVNRDENTNTISITAYDVLYKASKYTVADLELSDGYRLRDMMEVIASTIGAGGCAISGIKTNDPVLDIRGANFDGSENLRSVLNAIAEATQTIYYIDDFNNLIFKRLDKDGEPVATITRDEYYILDSKTNRRLSTIAHVTELGDNVSADMGVSGSTQYIRNNPFWELRDDVGTLLENALAAIGGLTINQFTMNWSGNFLLEIGDKIAITLEDDSLAYSYILNDVVRFLGYVDEDTEWNYEDNDNETPTNPSTLGEALKQTYARVDKANQQIELVANKTNSNRAEISQLTLTTESINANVKNVEQRIDENTQDIDTLTQQAKLAVTADDVTIAIETKLESGVEKVVTAEKKYTFDDEGMKISSSESSVSTVITEDGMKIKRDSNEVLTADNTGVNAENLHATTYLFIGGTSRFEDFDGRTCCFWFGG